jgi:serine/threonine protein kinase
MALSARTRVGPYEVLSLVGSGGMGEVYRARDDGESPAPAATIILNWADGRR